MTKIDICEINDSITIVLWKREKLYKVMVLSGKQQFPLQIFETDSGRQARECYNHMCFKGHQGLLG